MDRNENGCQVLLINQGSRLSENRDRRRIDEFFDFRATARCGSFGVKIFHPVDKAIEESVLLCKSRKDITMDTVASIESHLESETTAMPTPTRPTTEAVGSLLIDQKEMASHRSTSGAKTEMVGGLLVDQREMASHTHSTKDEMVGSLLVHTTDMKELSDHDHQQDMNSKITQSTPAKIVKRISKRIQDMKGPPLDDSDPSFWSEG